MLPYLYCPWADYQARSPLAFKRTPALCYEYFLCLLFLACVCRSPLAAQDNQSSPRVPLLAQSHSHNDYEHTRPLLDALDLGFCSIEADIFLVDGKLLVAHDLDKTNHERTLDALYLKPLHERFVRNGGSIFKEPANITLLIDIKSNGASTYAELHKQLERYEPIISCTIDGKFHRKAVTVIVSGDRAWNEIAQSNPRYVGIDGRLSDLESDRASDLVPLISDNWRNHFQWTGQGPMPASERTKLNDIVTRAQEQGRQVRFWATPESELVWTELKKANVDFIGTDDLQRLRAFLLPHADRK